jgi:hypothetical protein
MRSDEDISEPRREPVAIREWDRILSYGAPGAGGSGCREEIESYRARALRRREILRKMDNLVTRAQRSQANSGK